MHLPLSPRRYLRSQIQEARSDDDDDNENGLINAMILLISSTFLTKIADTLSSPKIILTALLQMIGASSLAVSLLVPLRESGALLPQIWLAGYVARYPRLGSLYSIGTLAQGIAAAGMLLSAWWLEGIWAGWIVVGFLGLLSIARALCSISFKGVLGQTVPGGLRGRTTGWASSAAGGATIIISVILLLVPERNNMASFMVFLGLAAICWWLAAAAFRRLEVPDSSTDSQASVTMTERLGLIRDQPAFRRFVIVRSLLVSTALIAPWYVMLSVTVNQTLSSVGALLLASGLASFISSPFWGRYSDRSSRWVLQVSASCVALLGALSVTLFVLTPTAFDSVFLVPALYFVLEVAHQGVRVGRKTYVVDLSNDDNRVDYVAVSNTLIGIIILAMGIVTGILSIWLSPISLIALFSIISAIGAWTASSLPEALDSD